MGDGKYKLTVWWILFCLAKQSQTGHWANMTLQICHIKSKIVKKKRRNPFVESFAEDGKEFTCLTLGDNDVSS